MPVLLGLSDLKDPDRGKVGRAASFDNGPHSLYVESFRAFASRSNRGARLDRFATKDSSRVVKKNELGNFERAFR